MFFGGYQGTWFRLEATFKKHLEWVIKHLLWQDIILLKEIIFLRLVVNIDGVQLDLGKITITKYAKTWHKQKVVFNYKAMKNCLKKFIVKY